MAVKLAYENSDNSPAAFLVQFTNGELKSDVDVSDLPKVTLFTPENGSNARTANRRILLAETPRMTYLGKNFGPDRHPDNFCKYLVGVMDRLKGEMTLHNALAITMHPKPSMTSSESEEESSAASDMNYREKYTRMIESFGSGRKRKLVETQQNSQLEQLSLESSMVTAKEYAHTELDDDSPSLAEQQMLNQARLIPPFNAEAETPMEVFKLEDLITPEEYDCIKDVAQPLTVAKQMDIEQWRTEKKYPEYILGQVERLWALTASKTVKRRARCLTYLSFLMAIYSTPHRELSQKGLQNFNLPSPVEKRVRTMFTELQSGAGRKPCLVIPPRLKDKLLIYILVLALHIENFSFNCSQLAKDLGLQPQKMGEYWRTVGCHMKSEKRKGSHLDKTPTLSVELKVPFKLPSPRKRSAKRNR